VVVSGSALRREGGGRLRVDDARWAEPRKGRMLCMAAEQGPNVLSCPILSYPILCMAAKQGPNVSYWWRTAPIETPAHAKAKQRSTAEQSVSAARKASASGTHLRAWDVKRARAGAPPKSRVS
jgi:hypothetical protein